ncbi:hypothetical protein PoB_002198700 [Plakobranchus ocellatus]|uniref:Uncharacterized protein n=1 Tax=Plakobranchus ocellatus TaxID=259542 RepID=A0AAV3ZLT8_9GAST|nr:hypothetical protein PoB_002198700 [Plakobranchus ocellatus]
MGILFMTKGLLYVSTHCEVLDLALISRGAAGGFEPRTEDLFQFQSELSSLCSSYSYDLGVIGDPSTASNAQRL